MAKAVLICGKICSGKTFYTQRLRKELSAAVLSCDEITLSLFDGDLGDKHDEMAARVQKYLFGKSAELLDIGVNVILEWGFWTKADRDFARNFYTSRGYECELHYVDISDEAWRKNIAKRNKEVAEGKVSAYFLDEGLTEKLQRLFEYPDRSETDVWYENVGYIHD